MPAPQPSFWSLVIGASLELGFGAGAFQHRFVATTANTKTYELSHFFIRRPIFAGVLSINHFHRRSDPMVRLPISEYPEVVPPTIVVPATYPGANPKTISENGCFAAEAGRSTRRGLALHVFPATGDGVMTLTDF